MLNQVQVDTNDTSSSLPLPPSLVSHPALHSPLACTIHYAETDISWLAVVYRKSGNFRHVTIFRVKIFSYTSRPYEIFKQRKIFNNENLASKPENGNRRQIECILGHHSYKDMLERCYNATGIPTTRRIDTKERSRRRSSVVWRRPPLPSVPSGTVEGRGGRRQTRSSVGLLPARKMTARSSYGGRLHGNLGREDTPQRRLARSSCSFSQPVAVEK